MAVGGITRHLVSLGVEIGPCTTLLDNGFGGFAASRGKEIASVAALAVGHLASDGVGTCREASERLLHREICTVPHFSGSIEALIAPCTCDSPSWPAVASKVGGSEERGDVDGRLGCGTAEYTDIIRMEAGTGDSEELEMSNLIARLVTSQFLTVTVAVGGSPEAEPVSRVSAVLDGPRSASILWKETCPRNGVRLIVCAPLLGCIVLRLQ